MELRELRLNVKPEGDQICWCTSLICQIFQKAEGTKRQI